MLCSGNPGYKTCEGIGKIETNWLIRQTVYIDGKLFFNAPLWFLIVLFEIYVVEIIVDCYNRSLPFKLVFLGIIFIIGAIITPLGKIKALNYFGLNRMLICLFFFETGVLFRYLTKRKEIKKHVGIECIITIALSILWGVLANLNGFVSVYGFIIGNYYLFVINAFLGTAIIIEICRVFFNKNNMLCKLSKYSVLILGIQFFLITPFLEKTRELGISKTLQYDLMGAFVMIIVLVIVPLVYRTIKKRIPMFGVMNGEIK